MNTLIEIIKQRLGKTHKTDASAFAFLKYLGPGLLVTVGFIDPGNWASNISACAGYGYRLLWMVTLSTIMLIILQHNSAHLGIVTGYCLSESASVYFPPWLSRLSLATAVLASVSTALAEILGGAIALNMLFGIPIKVGAILVLLLVMFLLFTNSYKKLERWIIGFVSIIGISFLFELYIVHIDWNQAVTGWVSPDLPQGSLPVIMSVLGAVVMPHNLFLHSEIIQSRQWNLENEKVIKRQLKYEFLDTLLSMLIGWAINSAMILVAASAFYSSRVEVTELTQAQQLLKPLLGSAASVIFAVALLFSGISSSVTAGMAGGSIFSGIFKEPYNIRDIHSKVGVCITLITATFAIFLITNPFEGLVYSQIFLSIQLPITVFVQIFLTSSKKVMGMYANDRFNNILLWGIAGIVTILNIMLLKDIIK